jgi:hypothetical protein
MAIIAKAGGDGQSHTPAPVGVHRAVCVDVLDKGIVEVTWQGKTKKQHKISIAWQIDELRDDGKRFLVYKRYTLSLHEKAGLRKDLESWRGKAFTRDEEMGFDVESVVGSCCLLNVVHNTVGEKTYANVDSVMPLMKGMPQLAVVDYVRESERATETETAGQERQERHASDYDPSEPPMLTDSDIPF